MGVFLDDFVITGAEAGHIYYVFILHEVFARMQKYGSRIKKDKCIYFSDSVTYLGFIINRQDVHTCPDKIEAGECVRVAIFSGTNE